MRFKEEKEAEAELQMGPMIDCVFLLLLYFISAAKIKVEEKYLGLMVPGSASESKESLPIELTLAIAENNQVFCNEIPMDSPGNRELPMVRAKLRQALELFGDKQPVVIHPQPGVRQQRIVDVLNACSGTGVKNLSFFAN
ncbi:MAG: ExbD/TolR family protein [Kiritimatiellia bacterium]|nr:biopolymer transporter ExbD [Lentisphaerota bacterium]